MLIEIFPHPKICRICPQANWFKINGCGFHSCIWACNARASILKVVKPLKSTYKNFMYNENLCSEVPIVSLTLCIRLRLFIMARSISQF